MKRVAIALLSLIILASVWAEPYTRKNWLKGWAKVEGCLNTRHWLLKTRSLIPATYKTERKCRVVSGKWLSAYSGKYIYKARKAHIEHVVALKYAHTHGGKKWTYYTRKTFANYTADPSHLLIVEGRLNTQKGAKGPTGWVPPINQCWYISTFLLIMNKWGLSINYKEGTEMSRQLIKYCIYYTENDCQR